MVRIPPLKIYAQASRTGLTHWQDPKVFCLWHAAFIALLLPIHLGFEIPIAHAEFLEL
jgi:hypothetical protein